MLNQEIRNRQVRVDQYGYPIRNIPPHPYWSKMQIFDIGARLNNAMFRGIYLKYRKYKGLTLHESDTRLVVERGRHYGVQKYIIPSCSVYDI